MLFRSNPKAKASWDRKRSDLQDQSASAYDMSLAMYAAQANWTDQEIVDLLIASRRKHGDDLKLRLDYFERTLAKVRESNPAPEEVAPDELTESAEAERLTDLGNAKRLVRIHGNNLKYCAVWVKWLMWDDVRWRVDDILEVEKLTEDVARDIDAESARTQDAERRKALRTWANSSESAHRKQIGRAHV